MGKTDRSGDSGISGSLKNSLSKFTERVTLKAPSADELKKTSASKPSSSPPKASQPKPMSAPAESKRVTSPPAPSSGPTPARQASPAPTPASQPAPSTAAAAAPSNTAASNSGSVNKLGDDVRIEGQLHFSDRLVFNGRIKGEIKSNGALAVQRQAIVEASVSVKTLLVEGKIVGNITATESVRLGATAVVIGDIITGNLTVKPQATFNGQAKIGVPSGAAKPSPNQPVAKPSSTPATQNNSATKGQIQGKMPAPQANAPKPEGTP